MGCRRSRKDRFPWFHDLHTGCGDSKLFSQMRNRSRTSTTAMRPNPAVPREAQNPRPDCPRAGSRARKMAVTSSSGPASVGALAVMEGRFCKVRCAENERVPPCNPGRHEHDPAGYPHCTITFPKCSPLSSRLCAAPISASGYTLSTTGLNWLPGMRTAAHGAVPPCYP